MKLGSMIYMTQELKTFHSKLIPVYTIFTMEQPSVKGLAEGYSDDKIGFMGSSTFVSRADIFCPLGYYHQVKH